MLSTPPRWTTLFVSIVAIAVLLPFDAFAKPKWEFNDEDEGISLFIRPVKDSDINEIKAVAVVDCSTDEIWKLLTTDDSFVEIMPNVTVSRLVKPCGEDCVYYYQRLEVSGIDDRHYIIKIRWSVSQKDGINQYTRKWEVADLRPDPEEDVVIVERVSGSWKLRSVDDGTKTKLIYQNHIEIGGNVPALLSNEAAEDNAIDFFKNLRKACAK